MIRAPFSLEVKGNCVSGRSGSPAQAWPARTSIFGSTAKPAQALVPGSRLDRAGIRHPRKRWIAPPKIVTFNLRIVHRSAANPIRLPSLIQRTELP